MHTSCPGAPAQLTTAAGRLAEFQQKLYRCLTSRRDGLFRLADAVLRCGGRVTDLARKIAESARASALVDAATLRFGQALRVSNSKVLVSRSAARLVDCGDRGRYRRFRDATGTGAPSWASVRPASVTRW